MYTHIREWCAAITYRPGWSIHPAGDWGDRTYITIEATAPDVCNPGHTFHTSPLFAVPEPITRDEFYDWIIDVCIPGVEQHERYEWLRIDGQHWRDPHAVGMPAFATRFHAQTHSMTQYVRHAST